MKTVLFYAHRGGTGRSLCLANCAASLAMSGLKVLALDMDLDAGGLNIIFKGLSATREKVIGPKGFLKCLISADMEGIKDVIEHLKDMQIEPYKRAKISGELDVIPIYLSPMQQDVVQAKWSTSELLAGTLRSLKRNIEQDFEYDIMLVDLPTGTNPIKEVFAPMAEQAVVLSRPNIQGAVGTRMSLDEFADIGLRTVVVLSCVAKPESRTSKTLLKTFQDTAGLLKIDEIIPFDEKLAFFEHIPVITRAGEPLAEVYQRIAKMLVTI